MEFKKEIQLELKDLITFSLAASKPSLIITPIISTILYLILLYLIKGAALFEFNTLIIYIIVILLFDTIMQVYTIHKIKRKQKKLFDSSEFIRANYHTTINSYGIKRKSQYSDFNINWDQIFKVSELKNCYSFFTSSASAIIIPKRFLTQEEATLLRSLINENLDPKKNKLKSH